jgi:DNA-binding response OmpR family regulator
MPSVLICDPNQTTQGVLHCALNIEGFKVFEAGNTESARYQIIMNSPDFVLIDWLEFDITNMDIKRFSQQVKRIRPNTIFIFISHIGVRKDVSDFEEMIAQHGADDYILKPFNPAKVLTKLESWSQKANAS